MGLSRVILAVSLLSSGALAQQMPGADKAGPRLLSQLARAPRSNRTLRLLTVWGTPPGQRSGPCVGRVCAEICSPADLPGLLATPGLLRADLPTRYHPRLDVASALIGLPEARARTGLTGRGVLVAIIDTGLDWTHPDFIDDWGRTRVAWLLDQGHQPTGMHPELEMLGQGAVFRSDEIQAALESGGEPVRDAGLDAIGHGTHVAGIAVGDDAVYSGVAPEARLVVVKAIDAQSGFSEDRILAGLAFAREVAIREVQPLVINLSLGNQVGAHDGSEPVELALEALAGSHQPPCAVTVAAGNEGGLSIHARGAVREDGPELLLELLVPQTGLPAADLPAQVLVDLWAEGDSRFSAVLQAPSGWQSDPISPGQTASLQDSWSPDGLIEISAPAGPHPVNGLMRLTFNLRGEAGLPLSQGTWIIRLRGQARRIDAWIGDWDLAGGPVPRFVDRVEPAELVGPPATARGVIAVGAMDARITWPGIDGTEYGLTGAETGQRTPFSVLGPTRDGRLKPDLVAPGRTIASSMSGQATAHSTASIFYTGGSQRKVLPDGLHAVSSGTSMAAPFVAGACALALEREPGLTGSDLRGRLQVSTQSDELTGQGLFDPGWGFGKLWLDRLLGEPSNGEGQGDPHTSLCGAARGWLPIDDRQLVQVAAVPRDTAGWPLGPGRQVNIEAPGGFFAGPVIDHGTGLYTRALIGSGPRGARIRLTCELDGQFATSQPVVVLAGSAEEAGADGVRGGAVGCATGSQGLAPGAGLLFCLGLGWLGLVGLGWIRSRNSRSSWTKSNHRSPTHRPKK